MYGTRFRAFTSFYTWEERGSGSGVRLCKSAQSSGESALECGWLRACRRFWHRPSRELAGSSPSSAASPCSLSSSCVCCCGCLFICCLLPVGLLLCYYSSSCGGGGGGGGGGAGGGGGGGAKSPEP